MIRSIIILLCLVTCAIAATTPVAPTLDEGHRGGIFSVKVNGTQPITYQWYRQEGWGRPDKPVTDNWTAQTHTLEFCPDLPAGVYYCIATNVAGSVKSKTYRLSYTTSEDAADMQLTIKKP